MNIFIKYKYAMWWLLKLKGRKMKRNLIKISLTAAILMSSGAYANQIIGADVTDPVNR